VFRTTLQADEKRSKSIQKKKILSAGPKRSLAPAPDGNRSEKQLPQANEKPVITDLVCELVLLFLFFQRKERQGKMHLGIAI